VDGRDAPLGIDTAPFELHDFILAHASLDRDGADVAKLGWHCLDHRRDRRLLRKHDGAAPLRDALPVHGVRVVVDDPPFILRHGQDRGDSRQVAPDGRIADPKGSSPLDQLSQASPIDVPDMLVLKPEPALVEADDVAPMGVLRDQRQGHLVPGNDGILPRLGRGDAMPDLVFLLGLQLF